MKREVEELFTWGCGGLGHHRGLPISKRTAACGLAIVPPPPSHATTSSLHHRLFTFCRSHAVRAFASLTRSYYVPSAAASSPKTPSSTSVCLCVCVCLCAFSPSIVLFFLLLSPPLLPMLLFPTSHFFSSALADHLLRVRTLSFTLFFFCIAWEPGKKKRGTVKGALISNNTNTCAIRLFSPPFHLLPTAVSPSSCALHGCRCLCLYVGPGCAGLCVSVMNGFPLPQPPSC